MWSTQTHPSRNPPGSFPIVPSTTITSPTPNLTTFNFVLQSYRGPEQPSPQVVRLTILLTEVDLHLAAWLGENITLAVYWFPHSYTA